MTKWLVIFYFFISIAAGINLSAAITGIREIFRTTISKIECEDQKQAIAVNLEAKLYLVTRSKHAM